MQGVRIMYNYKGFSPIILLQIISGLGLPVSHGAFFYAHEGRIRSGLGIGVVFSKSVKMTVVFHQLATDVKAHETHHFRMIRTPTGCFIKLLEIVKIEIINNGINYPNRIVRCQDFINFSGKKNRLVGDVRTKM